MYRAIEEFHDADPRRRHSDEADYGSHWRLYPFHGLWRVSYVRDTGEVYAVRQSGRPAGPVLILGTVSADEVADDRRGLYYRTLDRILEGWSERCTGQDSLRWVKGRLRRGDWGRNADDAGPGGHGH